MIALALNSSRDDLADAADLALTHLAQQVPPDYQLTVVALMRPVIRSLRRGGTDWADALARLDSLPAINAEALQPLRRALIAFSVEVQR
ncbi:MULTISPECIES: hypothetical protein [unclassified Rhodanobacter]|uniref:hypothetical protein n=1 Tax=unclassified Rhodanobacter TaxID=2621553 RepID=UPI001BDF7F2F|nr:MULTISPECIES: hypothetical protein [unclassified Rhodanobacter]MBT2145288.1 hypothetical protein [Rhodanobacter sp. LX-99]MBT2149333.1 hypothetical protein [Rhodanobacter sp. LX-100]